MVKFYVFALLVVIQITLIAGGCPPDESVTKPPFETAQELGKKICDAKKKPGSCKKAADGGAEWKWLWPKIDYWIGVVEGYQKGMIKSKIPRENVKKDALEVIKTCHKGSDYCVKKQRDDMAECVKGEAIPRAAGYLLSAQGLCPAAEAMLKEWKSKHAAKAQQQAKEYIAWKKASC